MRFFKNGCDGGNWKFLLEMGGGARNGRIGFIMGGWEIFKFSSHSWQRGANPLFYEDPLFRIATHFHKQLRSGIVLKVVYEFEGISILKAA